MRRAIILLLLPCASGFERFRPMFGVRMPALNERAAFPARAGFSPLDGEGAYNSLLEATRGRDEPSIVEFVSKSCLACKAMRPKMERMTNKWPDVEFYEICKHIGHSQQTRFSHLPSSFHPPFESCVADFESADKQFFKGCGVRVVPHVHIVTRGEVLESFACPPSKLKQIEEKLKSHGYGHLKRPWFRRRWTQLRSAISKRAGP